MTLCQIDAVKSKEEVTTPLVPPDYYGDYGNLQHGKLQYSKPEQPRKIACPAGYTGLLPHPDTCKKFLQCERGGTFVMDCGPGTAFNPAISVCDWPYNVPSCNEGIYYYKAYFSYFNIIPIVYRYYANIVPIYQLYQYWYSKILVSTRSLFTQVEWRTWESCFIRRYL